MKYLVSFYFWTTGVLFFGFSLLILVPLLLTAPRHVTYSAIRFFFKIQLFLMGIRLEVKGEEYIQKNHSYLIMGNHQSLFDLFVVPSAISAVLVGVEAAYHFSLPVWGYLTRKWGNIPIERGHLAHAIKSLETAENTLKSGLNIAILPEGHRTRTGRMAEFKKGPFHLALKTGADILPFGINGLYEYQQKGSFLITPGKVIVTIGKPIPYHTFKDMTVDALREHLFKIIKNLSGESE